MTVRRLTRARFNIAAARLCRAEPALGGIVERYGMPPFWHRPPGFQTLLRIILEQQVSLDSARQAFARLHQAVRPLDPARLASIDESVLSGAGLTRQKRRYCRQLAIEIHSGRLDLAALAGQDDAAARQSLISVKGVGPWTADIYLLVALRRPDLWPLGDLALVKALHSVYRLPRLTESRSARLAAIGETVRPWRSVAVRLLWHQYLRSRGRHWHPD